MRRIFGHKWAVGAAALMLVFALGAVSWAATGDTTPAQAPSDDTTTPAGPGPGMLGPVDGHWGDGPHFGRGMRGGAITDEMRAQMEERRAAREAQRQAFLDLLRDKMSSEDQAALDELLGTAETQRAALEEAQQTLQDTTSKIRDLIGTYVPLGDVGGDGGNTTSTTPPAADGASM